MPAPETPLPIDLALAFAPAAVRPAWQALFGLDRRLGQAVAAAREPQLAAIRLKWWEEALGGLPYPAKAPPDPLLIDLSNLVRRHDVSPETLAGLISGWAELLDSLPLGEDVLRRFAEARGDLFGIAARIADYDGSEAARTGAVWALYDLSSHVSNPATAAVARRMADRFNRGRLPRRLTALAIIAEWARMAAEGPVSPRRRALAAMRIALIRR